jgi:hypothetical protein
VGGGEPGVMGELTLTVMRLGLLVLLWVFVFAVVGVLRGDLYGTRVRRRAAGAGKAAARGAAPAPPREAKPDRKARSRKGPTKLVVTAGPLAGTTLPLRPQGTLIGRSPECALVLDDDYASGRHCRIYPDPTNRGGWVVEDLGSTNGTFMGRDKLTSARPVEIGTTLRIGKTVLELRG